MPRTPDHHLTKAQRKALRWLAGDARRYLVAYGQQRRTVYALERAGLVELTWDISGGAYFLTDAGREEAGR